MSEYFTYSERVGYVVLYFFVPIFLGLIFLGVLPYKFLYQGLGVCFIGFPFVVAFHFLEERIHEGKSEKK